MLESLGVDASAENDVTRLVHVRSRAEIKAAEEIAQRTVCADFERFKPIFDAVQRQLASGERRSVKHQDNAAVEAGDLFVLDGQMVLVAEMGKAFTSDYGWRTSRSSRPSN